MHLEDKKGEERPKPTKAGEGKQTDGMDGGRGRIPFAFTIIFFCKKGRSSEISFGRKTVAVVIHARFEWRNLMDFVLE
jgi:hypothetical protein